MRRKKHKKQQSGAALILAVTMVIILALLGVGLIRLGLNARMQAVKDILQISARSAADAGMEHAERKMVNWWKYISTRNPSDITAYLTGNTDPFTGLLTDTFGGANYSYTVTTPTGIGAADVTSTGTAGNVTRTVHAKLGFHSEWQAIGVKDNIDIGVNGGLYTIPEGEELTIQTNSEDDRGIVFRQGLEVPGDVLIGLEGNPGEVIDAKNKVFPSDDATWGKAPAYMDFPPQNPPTTFFEPGLTSALDATDPNILVITGNGIWNGNLDIKTTASTPDVIQIDGNNGIDDDGQLIPLDIYITGDVTLGKGGELMVTTGSAVNLWLGGYLLAKNDSIISYEGMPPNPDPVADEALIVEAAKSLTLRGTPTCTSIKLLNDGDFYGKINAPEAYLIINNSGNLYGAIMASAELFMHNGGDFYFVAELYEWLGVTDYHLGIIPGSWWEE